MRERAKEQYDMELRDKGYRLCVNMRVSFPIPDLLFWTH